MLSRVLPLRGAPKSGPDFGSEIFEIGNSRFRCVLDSDCGRGFRQPSDQRGPASSSVSAPEAPPRVKLAPMRIAPTRSRGSADTSCDAASLKPLEVVDGEQAGVWSVRGIEIVDRDHR